MSDDTQEDIIAEESPSLSTSSPASAITSPTPSTSEIDPFMTAADLLDYRPAVKAGVWTLSELDLEFIAEGCYFLGCGGGGSPHHIFLELRQMHRNGDGLTVVDLASLADDAQIGWGGHLVRQIGAEQPSAHKADRR